MILELAILVGIIVFVHWWEYRSSIQEYVFAQPATLERHAELCGLIKEKLPIAVEVESLPWRPAIAEKASWSVQTPDGIIPASEWTTSIKPILNGGVLASEMEIQMGLADIDAARPWWWMPGIHDIRVDILNSNEVMNLSWVFAFAVFIKSNKSVDADSGRGAVDRTRTIRGSFGQAWMVFGHSGALGICGENWGRGRGRFKFIKFIKFMDLDGRPTLIVLVCVIETIMVLSV